MVLHNSLTALVKKGKKDAHNVISKVLISNIFDHLTQINMKKTTWLKLGRRAE